MKPLHLSLLRPRVLFTLLALCLWISFDAHACEICGCGNNNFQIGILPTFSKGFFGLRYTTSSFNSTMRDDVTQYSHDYYKTTEIWGGVNFNRFQVMAFVPYFSSRKVSDDGTTASSGLGDAMLLVNYKVFSTASLSTSERITTRNELYFGGGVKLPTGVSQVDTTNPDFNIGDFNSQAGTGSVDYLANVTHNLMINKGGLVTNFAYRINSANSQSYRFGNRVYLNTSFYHTFSVASLKIKPNAGINFQSNAINKFNGSEVENTNGYNMSSTIGLNVLQGKVGVNALAFFPLAQSMYDGQTKLQSRVILGLTYSF